jgi:hypothetical protein
MNKIWLGTIKKGMLATTPRLSIHKDHDTGVSAGDKNCWYFIYHLITIFI